MIDVDENNNLFTIQIQGLMQEMQQRAFMVQIEGLEKELENFCTKKSLKTVLQKIEMLADLDMFDKFKLNIEKEFKDVHEEFSKKADKEDVRKVIQSAKQSMFTQVKDQSLKKDCFRDKNEMFRAID